MIECAKCEKLIEMHGDNCNYLPKLAAHICNDCLDDERTIEK